MAKHYVLLISDSPEALIQVVHRCSTLVSGQDRQWLKELHSLNRFGACGVVMVYCM